MMERDLLENVKKAYHHLKLIGQRPGIVKNTLLFTLEQVANASVQTQNSLVFTQGSKIDVKEYFFNLLYENERERFFRVWQKVIRAHSKIMSLYFRVITIMIFV